MTQGNIMTEKLKENWWAHCLREGLGHADIHFGSSLIQQSADMKARRCLEAINEVRSRYPGAALALDEAIRLIGEGM